MRISDFTYQLKHFDQLDNTQLEQLKTLQSQFPYCQSISLLLTKGFYDNESIDYAEQLKRTAILVPDRDVLFQLIYKKSLIQAEETSVPSSVLDTIDNKVDEVIQEDLETSTELIVEDNVNEESSIEPAADKPEEVKQIVTSEEEEEEEPSEATLKIEHQTAEPVDDSEEVKNVPEEHSPSKYRDYSELENEIITNALSSTYVYNIEREFEEPVEEIEFDTEFDEVDQAIEIIEKTEQEERSFYDWLSYGDSIEKPVKVNVENKQKALEDIVENFIKTEPQISPASKNNFFSPSIAATKSNEDIDSFTSATLAEIYVKQGQYSKAIKAFEILSLKNPEKKPYFVDRIAEVKRIQKQKD